MTFGEKVKATREKKGLSQSTLAKRMHVSQQAVAKYEKIVEQPKLSTVRKIAEALEISISELVNDWRQYTPEEIAADIESTAKKGLTHASSAYNGDNYTGEELEEIIEKIKTSSKAEEGLAILKQLTDDLPERAGQMISYGKGLLESIDRLNDAGQQKVKDYADDLAENPKYRKGTE